MVAAACSCGQNDPKADFPYNVPAEYLEEAENIPSYWIATTAEVEAFLKKNVKKGTATVTLRGIGDFGGEKTVKFKIVQKNVTTNWWNKK